ncbi:sodium/hydrogen exchanger 11 isoform X3 [Odocoileus virginianus]|uniref:Sodium/hydrogen exchanger 11 isoform X3 n=1 Tax=Odocoileus virginianus TaxID=9874 RepID=A0A6J0Y9N2_ODOVR
MSKANVSFWVQKEGNRPDLLCGRAADYPVVKGHFLILVWSTLVLGGLLRAFLKNSEVIVLTILSLFGFLIGQLAYDFVEMHQIVYPLLRTSSFSLYCYFSPLIIFMAALDVDFYILKNVFWQVFLTGLISFATTFIIIGYVVLKFNKHSWDLESCLLFSMALGITDPIYSVNSLKTIGISKMYTDIIRGESMIICGFTSICFSVFQRGILQMSSFRDLCTLSIPRQMAMQNAIKHIQEMIQSRITLFKTEKLLTNVNWTLVEEKTKIEYIIPTSNVSSDNKAKEELPTDEVLLEEARLHVVIIQISSFEKQCNDGVLSVEAARTLIGATKSYCHIQGKFMSIYDVSTYVRARSWLVKFKHTLTFLEYHKDKTSAILYGHNRFLLFIYHIVFSEEFENAEHIIGIMYIYPMIMHLWPTARKLNVSGLIFVNYYFVCLYLLESALKIIILKKKYFHQHWNTLEFFIVIIGIVDVFCIYFVRLRPDNLILIQFTVIIGYFRIIRFFPLLKIIIPLLINIVDVQIKKRLSLTYSITKGYVKSLEDTKFLIRQISSRKSIDQKLYEILETNKQDAVKELGLIEHEGRDVVIALKTKQAIRNVIAKALKSLTFLSSRGIIDKYESLEMNKVLLEKIKPLNNFPMAIPLPTPDKYLHNIIWLENKDALIEFFKERAKLAYFDYGDVICKEGEMPQGIYLIISGMAILESSPPTFGIDRSLRPDRESTTRFTEYCTSGDIIGELSCLLKREIEYTAICETILQACFISLEDLYEGFDFFWPSLEYKIWLKLALSIAYQYFESSLVDEDLKFQKCVMLNHAYVETLSSYNEMSIDDVNMKFVILVYGSVIDTKTEVPYFAPCILPKPCEQVQGTSDLSKLLVIQALAPDKNDNAKVMGNTGLGMTKRDYQWKKKDELEIGSHFRKGL